MKIPMRLLAVVACLLTLWPVQSHAQQDITTFEESASILGNIDPKADDITFSPDRSLVFAAYSEKKDYGRLRLNKSILKIWRLDENSTSLVWQWNCAGYAANQLAVSPDGQELAVACTDGKTRLWGVDDGKFKGALPALKKHIFPGATATTFSPDSQSIVVSNVSDKNGRSDLYEATSTVRVFSGRSLKLLRSFEVGGVGRALCLSPDQTILAATSDIGIHNQVFGKDAVGRGALLALLNADTGQMAVNSTEFSGEGNANLAFFPQGKQLFVGWIIPGVEIVNVDKKADSTRFIFPPQPGFSTIPAALSPNGELIAGSRNSALSFEAVQIYRAKTGDKIKEFSSANSIVYVSFTPDSKKIIGIDEKGSVFSWNSM